MRIRRLVLRLATDLGPHGATIDFPDGLVVLWADNSMGKSTCLRSIVWVLGLEAMLTTNRTDVPLPPAMKAQLRSGEAIANVLQSEILLQIENSDGKSIVVMRSVVGSRDRHLVTVTHGPALTESDKPYISEDFFVARPGGATSEKGFHQFLSRFLGWDLPEVQTFDGRSCPLYLECIFPYLLVEQTRGWSTLQPPIPTQFRIRDAHKRTIEYLLHLDAHNLARRRQELAGEEARLNSEWSDLLREAKRIAQTVDGQVHGLPAAPTAIWPMETEASLFVCVNGEWNPAAAALAMNDVEIAKLVDQELPRVAQIATTASVELADAEKSLSEKEALRARILAALDAERAEADEAQKRLTVLEDDLRRNKDVRTLRVLGSNLAPELAKGECPTCHQRLRESLTTAAETQAVMSVDDNIQFIEDQRRTFGAVLANSHKIVAVREMQLGALRDEMNNLRVAIRALRQTLVADGRLPSIAAIQRRLELDQSSNRLRSATEALDELKRRFSDVATGWAAAQRDKSLLPKEDASAADLEKVRQFSSAFREQLTQFGFESFRVDEVSISEDSYRPERDGFDFPSSISASDFIRVIWSYLNGLLELSRTKPTSHPGFLLFDEPRQQSTKDLSFRELLRRVSLSLGAKQQVIFATSEKQANLKEALRDIPHTYLEFKGRIIKSLPNQ